MTTIPDHRLARGRRATRREFLAASSVSLALAGAAACQQSRPRRVVPHDGLPPEMVPGMPLHYATALVLDGWATGVLVRVREGRPIKIEGNPDHPASLGATTAWQQAAIYDLYDPTRLAGATRIGSLDVLTRERDDAGAGLRLWLEPTSSPLRAGLVARVLARWPEARVTFATPLMDRTTLAATTTWCGQALAPHADFAAARRIVVLDADPLGSGPTCLRDARGFAAGRRPGLTTHADAMSRLWVAEPVPSATGAVADVHLPCPPSGIGRLAAAILREVLVGLGQPVPSAIESVVLDEEQRTFAVGAAADLVAHRGASLVVVGQSQPNEVQVLGHVLDEVLGNVGTTRWYTEPGLVGAGASELPVEALVEDMHRGEVDTLLLASGDVAWSYRALGVGEALARVDEAVYWGRRVDDTAQLCRRFVPAAHDLESWGDARAYDGTLTTLQPVLEPLDGGRTLDEVLAAMVEPFGAGARELLYRNWTDALGSEDAVHEVVQVGLLRGSAFPRVVPRPRADAMQTALAALQREIAVDDALELVLVPDARLHDGRFRDNAWLQELPDPITKITWGNALTVAPVFARRRGLADGHVARLVADGRTVEGPVVVVPGQAESVVSVSLGHGSDAVDGWALWDGLSLRRSGARLVATERRTSLVRTQEQFDQHDRGLARIATVGELAASGDALTAEQRGPTRHWMMGNELRTDDRRWGMAIDLGTCTGCSACVMACQVENNTPVVGPDDVSRGREMHWLRIDRYYEGSDERPQVVHQPMLCQHCEFAPCEYVCPVAATVHSPDGLNEMVYNRCIGTRFCSNNCPYTVRRFNWFDYSVHDRRALAYNPDVTVRERGVMEKCTYCVQRIRRTEIAAKVEGRRLARDEVVTACQQACATGSILFGDLADSESAVSLRLQRPERYQALHQLGTEPRTHYLVKIVNPPEDA